DVEFVLRDHAAVRGSGHGGQHGSEPGITAEDFENHEAFVGSSAGAQAVGHGNGAGHTGAEADTVVGAGNIIVHGLRNSDYLYAFLMKPYAVAQRVIPANGDEVVDSEPIQVLQNFRGQVVFLRAISWLQMSGNAGLLYLAGLGARGVQERTASAAGVVDEILGQRLEVLAIVVVFFADDVDQPGPPPTDANHLAALAQRADGYGADGGVEAGYVAATGEDSDYTLFCFHVYRLGFADVGSSPLPSYSPLSLAAMNKARNRPGNTSPAFPKWHSVKEDAFAGRSGPT